MEETMYKVDTKYCDFDSHTKTLKLSSEFCGMPRELQLVSHLTGRIATFTSVQPGDELFDEDGYDGEMCYYRSPSSHWVLLIYNQY